MSYEPDLYDDFDDDPELSRAMRRNRPTLRTFATLPASKPTLPRKPRQRQTLTDEQRAELRAQTEASTAEAARLKMDSARLRFEIRVAELKRSGLRPSQAVFAAAAENRVGYRAWLRKANNKETS